MIVCRKPCTIYDVDVIGLAALVVIALATGFGVVRPACANASEYRALSASIAAANNKAEQARARLRSVEAESDKLRRGVADRAGAAPKPGAMTPFLQQVARLADECDLQIVQVLPQPTRLADGYRVGEVRFTGSGTSRGFARLLDQLAREIPYYALQDYAIIHTGDSADPRCTLSWTLCLYMLEDNTLEYAGEQP